VAEVRPPADTTDAKLADAEQYRLWMVDLSPDYRTGKEALAGRPDLPGEIWRWAGDPPTGVCRVNVNSEKQLTQVVALLPEDGTLVLLQPLLKACFIEALRQFPEAGPWPVNGTFEAGVSGEMKATTWRGVFPTTRIAADSNGRWVIEMGKLSDAVAVVERWVL
jgi:hypothetical protein